MATMNEDLMNKMIRATRNGNVEALRETFLNKNKSNVVCVDTVALSLRIEDFLDRFQLERGGLYYIKRLLCLAVYEQQTNVVSFLLSEQKASINVREKDNKTPLHIAVCSPSTTASSSSSSTSKLAMVRLLVENGADLHAVDDDGQTALHLVFANNMNVCLDEKEELIRYLVHQGCSLSHQDSEGYSPFHLACSDAPTRIANVLLELGASPTLPDNDGWAPIQIAACSLNSAEVLQLLLDAGASANVQSAYDKNTPAHFAKSVAHARILFESGQADLSVRNMFGETPALMAAGRKRFDVAYYFYLAQAFATKRQQYKQLLFVNNDDHDDDDVTKEQGNTSETGENSARSAAEATEGKPSELNNTITSTSTKTPAKASTSTTHNGFALGMLSPVLHQAVNSGCKEDLVSGYACLREAIFRLA